MLELVHLFILQSRRVMVMAKLLIVDDEKMIATVLAKVLAKSGHQVHGLNSGIAAIEYLQNPSNEVALVIMDLLMPELSGAEVLDWIHVHRKSLKVIMMTAYGDPEVRADLMHRGASLILSKPFDDVFAITGVVDNLLREN